MQNSPASSELRVTIMQLQTFFMRAALFSLFISILVLAPTGYMLQVYSRVVDSRSSVTLFWLTVLVLGVYALMELLAWGRAEVMRAAAERLDEQLATRVLDAVFTARLRHLPCGSEQLLQDFYKVRDFLFSPALLAIMEVPVALLIAVLLFLISPWLGWSAVAFGIAQTLVALLNERSTKQPLAQASLNAFQAQQHADGALRNAQVIAAMGMLYATHRSWMKKQGKFLTLQAQASERAGAFQSLTKLLQLTLSALMLGLGCWLSLQNELWGGAGMMIVGSILGGRMLAPLVQLVAQWKVVVGVRESYQRLEELLVAIPKEQESMSLPAPQGRLQVEQLVAGAPGVQAAILRGITFTLLPGEVLAVVGPSASGKSTLARLLVGLWPSMGGAVRLDGVDIYSWNKAELGPHVGYLPQVVELFEGTVAQNIARFGEVDMQKVRVVAALVGVQALIDSLPHGYETEVGPGGKRLSGGQRQRIGLARALYGDPKLIVLDEPNSNLDDEGDAALASAIEHASARGATVVVITHRSGVLSVTKKMLLMSAGVQQAFGLRDEVLSVLQQGAMTARQTV